MWRIGKQIATRFGHAPNITGTGSLAVWRAAQRRSVKSIFQRAILALAPLHRTLLPHVTFIGVTGSCGKTTTKELIAAVLSARFRGRSNFGNRNSPGYLARTILSVRPWDKFCVLEIGLGGSGIALDGPLWLVRPRIGVVTNIGTDHLSAFHSLEAIAAEKSKVIAALPANGTAVLNADDTLVRAMQEQCAGRVITCGVAPDGMLRAENICASWPDRLSFTVRYDGQSHRVHTQLCGAHWVPCVLAALAVGLAMGISLQASVHAIQTVRPYRRRMSPVDPLGGVTFIQDDAKAPLWSIPATLQFMKEARAGRKIIVIGSLSDYAGNSDRTYISVARQALDVADRVIFVGARAGKCLKARRHAGDESLQAFYSAEAAAGHLRNWLRPGDLVLLKGSERDHLEVIVDCWRLPNAMQAGQALPHTRGSPQFAQVVVGLGNPGAQYEHTPHNVGHHVLDHLARSLAGDWVREDKAMIAHIEWRGQRIDLIKPLAYVNASGSVLLQLGNRHGFGPADCVLVHDDLDLPLGSVRVCDRGSDGGHRGVRSIFEAFRTDAIRRVRIGVGRPEVTAQPSSYVLTVFSPLEQPVIERGCAEAVERLQRLLADAAVRP